MAVNKRKVLEAARKFATKGAKDKALKEYDKLLKLDPRDAKLRLEIGDVHRRWGQLAEAAETYSKVAEQFMKEGFDARAVAVYKQIIHLDSESFACYEPLAELYQRMGLTREATSALQTAADGFHRVGEKAAALGLLRKMAMLEPTNTASRLKVADLLHREAMDDEAIVEYESIVEELQAQGDAEGVSKVYERLLDVQPERISSLTGYARNLIDRGAADRAEPFARRALDADASPAQYELLGEVFRATGRDEELVELYRQLAEVYRERGDEERTREILQRYVPPTDFANTIEPNGYLDESEFSPGDGEEKHELDGLDELDELGPLDDDGRDEFGDEDALLDEDLMADDSQLLGDGDSGFGIISELGEGDEIPIVDPASGPDSNEMTRVIPEDAEPMSHDIDQLFAEASVYLRYGKRDQAVANLESVLEIDSSHRGALEKLGEACVEAGDKVRAVELWSRAVKSAREDDELEIANAIRDRIAAIDAPAGARLEFEPAGKPPASDPDTEETPIPEDLRLLDVDSPNSAESSPDEIDLDDIEIDVEDASPAAESTGRLEIEPHVEVIAGDAIDEQASEALTFDASIACETNPNQITEDIEEADFYLQQGLLDEAEAIYSRVLELAPNHPHALVRMGEVAAQRGEDPGSSTAGTRPKAPPAATQRDVPNEPESVDIGEELTEWNDEVLLTEEVESGPTSGDSAGCEAVDQPVAEAELSVADLSMGSFAAVNATGDATGDLNGDTKDFLEDLPDDLPDSSEAANASLAEEIEIELDDDIEVDFDLDASDSDAGDVANEADPPEFMFELPSEEADPDSESVPVPKPAAQEPAAPELAVTNIDFDRDTDPSGGEARDEGEAAPEGDDFGFDLAAEIGQALSEVPNETTSGNSADTSDDGFAAVFAEFKKGVSETLAEGDFEAHYDLGIAYREMELFDDAITEFQAAMANPKRRLGCLHLLGLCALDVGRPEEATGHLQLALETEGLASEQLVALRFDLGRCFERRGDIDSAKREYLAVQTENPEFADVASRLEELGNLDVPTDDEPEYESFDEFFDDSDDDDVDDGGGDESDPDAEKYENFDDVIGESDHAPSEPERALDREVDSSTQSAPPIDAAPEPAAEASVRPPDGGRGTPEIVETEALVEAESDVEPEPGREPESVLEIEPEPETEPEPELPKARKKRKISFF